MKNLNINYKTMIKISIMLAWKYTVNETDSEEFYLNIFEKSANVKSGILIQWEKYK